jgi:hypothetical protein
MLDEATFRARKREFDAVSQAKVLAALAQAEKMTDASVFGTLTDDAHMWLTAHLLAADPTGKESRIKGEAFTTTYLEERQRLERICASTAGWV